MRGVIGTALISNSQVYEVGRLLYGDRGVYRTNDPGKVHDLLTLIDSLVLSDKLYTLPATINTDLNPFVLTLLTSGLLETYTGSENDLEVGKMIIEKINEIKDYKETVGGRGDRPVRIDYIKEIETFYSMSGRPSDDGRLDAYSGEYRLTDTYEASSRGSMEYQDSFEALCRDLVGSMSYRYSGAFEECTSYLRDMYYIFSAEVLEIPYYPQFSRVEFAKNFPNYYNQSFKTKLYSKIAKALDATISEVYDDFVEKPAYIPPFSSIVFDRSEKREDILNNILELRDEYAKTRDGFNQLEIERTESKNLKERLKISRRQRQLLEDAGKSFDNLSKINITSTIKYIPEVIKPLSSPADPTKYGANLLTIPIELLLEWWRKRPVKKMFDLKDKILEIEDYPQLIKKHFPSYDPKKDREYY